MQTASETLQPGGQFKRSFQVERRETRPVGEPNPDSHSFSILVTLIHHSREDLYAGYAFQRIVNDGIFDVTVPSTKVGI